MVCLERNISYCQCTIGFVRTKSISPRGENLENESIIIYSVQNSFIVGRECAMENRLLLRIPRIPSNAYVCSFLGSLLSCLQRWSFLHCVLSHIAPHAILLFHSSKKQLVQIFKALAEQFRACRNSTQSNFLRYLRPVSNFFLQISGMSKFGCHLISIISHLCNP